MPTLQERMKAKAKKAAVESLKETAAPKDGENPNLLGVPEAPPPPATRVIQEDVGKPSAPPGRVLKEGGKPDPKVPDTGEKADSKSDEGTEETTSLPKKRSSAATKKPDSLAPMRKPDGHPSPDNRGLRQGLKGKIFFNKIRLGEATVEDAWPYWRAVVDDSHQHLAFRGNLQTLLQEHPGLAFFYRSILTDAQQIRRWLEMKADAKEIEKYKWLMTSEDAKKEYGTLKTTEAAKFAKAEEEVLNLNTQVRVMADIEHHLDNVALGFQDRGIMLSHIRAVREAGHEEVWVDSNLETDTR